MSAGEAARRAGGWLRGALLTSSVILLAWLAHAQGMGAMLHRRWIEDHVLGHGLEGYALMLALTAVVTALGLPRQIPSLLAGYAFGAAVGFGVALAGTVAGAGTAYAYGRLLGRGLIPRRLRRRMAGLEALLARRPFSTSLAVRLFPFGSNLVTNLVAGLFRLPAGAFLAGSALGFAPQTLVFALMGKGLRVDPVWRIGLALLLFAGSVWLGQRLYRRLRQERGQEVASGRERARISRWSSTPATRVPTAASWSTPWSTPPDCGGRSTSRTARSAAGRTCSR
jgi:uncharacterized membrane protein YdjX (TVP38/TMEM64 family)